MSLEEQDVSVDASAHPVIEAELAQLAHEARRVAAGGWRRAAIGFGLGATTGLLVALVLPREAGARRTGTERPRPFGAR